MKINGIELLPGCKVKIINRWMIFTGCKIMAEMMGLHNYKIGYRGSNGEVGIVVDVRSHSDDTYHTNDTYQEIVGVSLEDGHDIVIHEKGLEILLINIVPENLFDMEMV
jgi:hypothetical protein